MLQRQLPDLGMQGLEIRRVRCRLGPAKDLRGPRQQLLFPFGDLSGVDAELLGQFGQRLVAFDGRHRDLRFEGCSVIPSRSLHRLAPLVGHLAVALVKPGYHLP
jgi:hypothetical protein